MKVVKKFVFYSPKSGGSTLISLNMMLAHQQWKSNKNIAYLQLSHFPDSHTYTGTMDRKTILDLKYLIDGKESEKYPLSDIFQSPLWSEWEELSVKDVKNILSFLEEKYDTIYIDLHTSVGEEILNEVLQQATKIVLPTNIDPASLSAVSSFFSRHEKFQNRCCLIFNQCPPKSASFLKQKLKNKSVPLLGTLPIAGKHLWAQVFEAFPLVFHKRSKWKKALFHLLKKLHT